MLGKSFGDWLILAHLYFAYVVSAGFHEPFGRGGGTADTYRLNTLRECRVNVFGAFNLVGTGVHLLALVEEDASVRTLLATYKEYQFVRFRKFAYAIEAVGDLSAYGVERFALLVFVYVCGNLIYNQPVALE